MVLFLWWLQVGVCQQVRLSDELCWNTTMQRSKQVRIATVPYFAGKVKGCPICFDV